MNNVSTAYSGAVSTKTLAGGSIGCKHFIDKKISIEDNSLIIKNDGYEKNNFKLTITLFFALILLIFNRIYYSKPTLQLPKFMVLNLLGVSYRIHQANGKKTGYKDIRISRIN